MSIAGNNVQLFAVLGWIISLLFAGCFFAIWLRWRSLTYIPSLSAAFVLQCVGQLILVVREPQNLAANTILSCAFYTAAAYALIDGATSRLMRPTGRRIQAILSLLIIGGVALFSFVINDLHGRIDVENFGFATMFLVAVWQMRKHARRWADRAMLWTLLLFGLHFFPRVLLSTRNLGHAYDPNTFGASAFWLWLNLAVILFAVVLGLALLGGVASDVVSMLLEEAATDSLTGLMNRREFERTVQRRLSWFAAKRVNSLVLCDIDHFKRINDTYGHNAGDIALQSIAETLTNCVRRADAVARIGGEEFAILLPGVGIAEAYLLAERLRSSIEELSVHLERLVLQVTASFGVVEVRGEEGLSEMLVRADRALYAAKNNGRNCVHVEGFTLESLSMRFK